MRPDVTRTPPAGIPPITLQFNTAIWTEADSSPQSVFHFSCSPVPIRIHNNLEYSEATIAVTRQLKKIGREKRHHFASTGRYRDT